MSSSISKPLLLSKLLDLHLSRVIAREHQKDRVMRKFVQLAEDVEADLKSLDSAADELQRRREENMESARTVINDHHRIQDRVEEGLDKMRSVVEAAGLSNSRPRTKAEIEDEKKEHGDKTTVDTQLPKTEPPPIVTVQGDGEPKIESDGGSGDTPASTFSKA